MGQGATVRIRRAAADSRQRIGAELVRRSISLAARLSGHEFVELDYPASALPRPRFGWDRPEHEQLAALLDLHAGTFRHNIEDLIGYGSDLGTVSARPDRPDEPYWHQGWLGGLDGASIYAFVRSRKASCYLEIGSGMSTLFAAKAKREGSLRTAIVSIDPQPRAVIDGVCDTVVRQPLELVQPSIFEQLQSGDILFMDSSHRVFMNSDVASFYLDVLPALPSGVLVGIHDIYLPHDYPADWYGRYYSEQYLLAVYLLAAPVVKPMLPCHHVSVRPEFRDDLDRLWASVGTTDLNRHGSTFWLET